MDLFGDPDPEEVDTGEDFTAPASAYTPAIDDTPPSPRTMKECFGHAEIERILLESFNAGRMPHGLIFSGPKGIGKATFAYRLAKFLFRQGIKDPSQDSLFGDPAPAAVSFDVPADHMAARLVASGAHPDLLAIERAYDEGKDKFKDSVAVDDVRRVAPFLRKTAAHGGWRVVVIDDADTMNRSAQNALLKILEEPPANTVLILIAHRMGTMVPTIRSRCRLFSFHPPNADDVSKILTAHRFIPAPGTADLLTALSEGSPGEALRFAGQGGPETLAGILSLLGSYPAWPWTEIHALSDVLARSGRDDSYHQFAELLPWIYRKMIRAKARGEALAPAQLAENDALSSLLRQSSLEKLLKICENLEELFASVDRSNLDKKQAVLSAFSLMAA
jgi:DNA polymerase III subunit delta'